MSWVFLDESCVPEEEAKIPVGDRGFLFGDGSFTTIRVNKGQPEFLKNHLDRLTAHCLKLNIEPAKIDPVWIFDLIRLNRATDGLWRLKIIVTGGDEATLKLHARTKGHIVMTLKPFHFYPLTPCRLCLFPTPIIRPVAELKTLAYLDRLMMYDYAHNRNYDDAISFSCEGYILETAFSNIFWSEGNKLFLPDDKLPYLKGIFLTQLTDHLAMKIERVKCGVEDIPLGAAVYTCNSMTHLRPVTEIDGRLFTRNEELEIMFMDHIEKVLR